jgi:hypothetical protein
MWFFNGAIKGFMALCAVALFIAAILATLEGSFILNLWLFPNWSDNAIGVLSLAETLVLIFMGAGVYDEWDRSRWVK